MKAIGGKNLVTFQNMSSSIAFGRSKNEGLVELVDKS